MTHAFYFALGPCQDWIKTSRKGRDLWFSSWLLSELARAAARTLAKAEGVEALVVPTPGDLSNEESSIPNKVIAVLERERPADLARKMEAAVMARLEELAQSAFSKITAEFDREVALAQVRDLPELSWAAVAFNDEDEYPAARRRAEALLNARKETRPFAPPTWGSAKPKSMLDGARESVIPERVYDQNGGLAPAELWSELRINHKERLCGLGLFKRVGEELTRTNEGSRVQSTSHVAAWRTRAAIEGLGAEGTRAFVDYVQALRRAKLKPEAPPRPDLTDAIHGYDAKILFENRLHDLLPGGLAGRKDSQDALRGASGVLSRLFADLGHIADSQKKPRPRRPKPYYAVLDADGDYMGATLAKLKTAKENRLLSQATTEFAAVARRIIQEEAGHTVYAGGDDLLALLPVERVIPCADRLQAAFVMKIQPIVKELLPNHPGPLPTLSAGVAIGHHTDPLQDTLEAAREAQQVAKQDEGRDAWCVTVLKRSGVPVSTSGKWARLQDLRALQELLSSDEEGLPRGLPYEIQAIRARLDDSTLKELWSMEVQRILLQKGMRRDDSAFKQVTDQMKRDEGDPSPLANRLLVARALTGLEGGEE